MSYYCRPDGASAQQWTQTRAQPLPRTRSPSPNGIRREAGVPTEAVNAKAPLESWLSSSKDRAALTLGAMNFGKRTPRDESLRVIARALELGITHIDTANAYNNGESERIVGEAIKGRRESVVVATKCGFGTTHGKPEGLSAARLAAAADESLQRLGTDYIDLYYLHVPDHDTPIGESLDAIAKLMESGKVRAWGVSNYAAWQVMEMLFMADARGMARPVIAQQLYNALVRQLDVEWFSFAREHGVHTTIYNPLAGGLLTGKHARDGSTQKGSRFDKNRRYQDRYFTPAMFDRTEELARVARAQGMSLLELAYAFCACAPGVGSIVVGPASVEQLDQGVEACKKDLSPETRAELDAMHRAWLGTDTYYVR